MSSIWTFPAPTGRPAPCRCRGPAWPGWALSTAGGWSLDALDPKLLMRLGPALADELARLDREPKATLGANDLYIVWED